MESPKAAGRSQEGSALKDQAARSRNGRIFGPGLVHLLGSVGPNDLIANSVAGATYGYSLLWAVVVAYLLNYAIAEASSRYVVATGESITEGYGRLGRPVVFLLAVAIFVRRHLNNLALVLLLGASVHMLIPLPAGGSATIWSAVWFALAFALMFRGGYRGVERFAKVLLVGLGGSFAMVAVLAQPEPAAVLRGLLLPSFPDQQGIYSHFLVLMAVAGSAMGSINHLKYPAFVYEKGWRGIDVWQPQRIDLALSVSGQLLMAVLIQIAAAATLHGRGAEIRTIEDLSRVFSEPLGEPGRIVIGVGLWLSVFTTYIGSNTGYSLIVADICERFVARFRQKAVHAREAMRRRIYRVLVTFFCWSPLYVLFTAWEPVRLSIFTGALFLVLSPLVLAGLLLLTSNRELMKNRASGVVSRAGLGVAIVVSLYLTWQNAFELTGKLNR
ncbi:MAG: Nramp family divalent metal transporter [Bryobacteraceae bacterium]